MLHKRRFDREKDVLLALVSNFHLIYYLLLELAVNRQGQQRSNVCEHR